MEMNNPYQDLFVVYEGKKVPEEGIELEFPLMDNPIRISSFSSITREGTPIVNNNLPKMINSSLKTDTSSPVIDNELLGMSFEDLIKLENLPIRITSGFRGSGSLRGGKTALGRRSNHNRRDEKGNPMAYDIVPTQGHTFEELENILYNNPRVSAWFKARKWGFLPEMIKDNKRGFYDVSGNFHYTGATGRHFHIGPDSHAVAIYNSKVTKAQEGMKFSQYPFVVYQPKEVPEVQIPKVELNFPLQNYDISDWANGVSLDGTPIVGNNLPRMIESQKLSTETYTLNEATNNSNAGSYKGYSVPSGNTLVSITEDLLGKDKDTGDSFTLNPSSLLGAATVLKSSASRRGNNPLSISPSKSDIGYSGSFKVRDGQNFASYNSIVDGLASAMRLYKRIYNNRSVRGINDGYLGHYELTKDNKALTKLRLIWITNISKSLGIDPTKRLNLDDKETMFSLMAAIAKQESSSTLGRSDLEAAWKKAFG